MVHEITNSGLPDDAVQSLFQDDRGRSWVSTRRGVVYFEDGRFVAVSGLPGEEVFSIAEDSAGDLWINQGQSVFHLVEGSIVDQIPIGPQPKAG